MGLYLDCVILACIDRVKGEKNIEAQLLFHGLRDGAAY